MKKLMILFSAIMMITVLSCDNNNNRNNNSTQDKHGGDTTNTDYDNNPNQNKDLNESDQDVNRRGNSSGTYNDGTRQLNDDLDDRPNENISSDNYPGNRTTSSAELPGEIRDKLQNDDAFKNMRLSNSRSYERNGKTFYEITLEEIDNNSNPNRGNTTSGDNQNLPTNTDGK